jgi:glucose/arabinose dehydrogenase
MIPSRFLVAACVVLFTSSGPAFALEVQPFLTNLSSPVYITHARDGSGRLFVVERAGVIKVVQPGPTTPTVFLDIKDRVITSGREQGLLGLTFHPQYPLNGRFFVKYTRKPDGATVVAEFRRSADPNVAAPTETVVLVTPHPTEIHNGGMIEFGPDGFLYISAGDGGDEFDPDNNAQNIGLLLGKILRIDVDRPSNGLPYGIPPDNPFATTAAGRPEIFALGLRNPFRFSFDRATGQLFVGDVGQADWEEIDIVTRGANLGWRVFEGNHCSALDPDLCKNAGFTPPIAEYFHDGRRCAVSGGYVYRGSRGTLPSGTYVFGDLCSGEIFTLSGSSPTVLIDTDLKIASFGEDQDGELYVVDIAGAVSRLVAPETSSVVASVLPSSRSVTVGTPATAFATIINTSGAMATGCRPSLVTPLAADFAYQTTDSTTNAVTGSPNTPVAIPAQSSQSFVFAITPNAAVAPASLTMGFQCQSGTAAVLVPGVHTLEFSADSGPVADIVAMVALPPEREGYVELSGTSGTDVFGVASINVGSPGAISVSLDDGGAGLPVALSICQSDAQAACLTPAAPSVGVSLGPGETASFVVFATGSGTIAADPGRNRIFVRFKDASGVVRGATSTAVRTR